MALKPGTHLGPYEILSQIGAGGMGEVYKARDTRLERFVAIKILPAHLADRPELRERFEREARTIAKLNHPHICTLYDVGRQELPREEGATAPLRSRLGEELPHTIDFLVMEYLEGETLAERLKKGPLPLEQVLRYAVEVSDALDKAHRAGVTHRDIKPGNIIVTKEGTKLLDFGLAKLKQEVAKATIPASEMPTVPGALTEHGTLLGTLHYMAPEQVEGKVNEIDARTDIFAFGALVYEMGTGKGAFPGETQASVIAKILEVDPPPMSELQPMMPPAIDRVVKKCLRKDAEERWQSARDVTDELKWISEGGLEVGVATAAATVPARAGLRRAVPMVLTAVVAIIITGIAVWVLTPTPTRPITRLTLALPTTEQLGSQGGGGGRGGLIMPVVALSPDGTRLIYVANEQLFLRPMDRLEATPIPGTEGAHFPFFSPDGLWVGFFADGKLKKVSVSGGAPLTLCDAPDSRGGSWVSDDTIVFTPIAAGGLWQVSAAGGTPQQLTSFDLTKGETGHWFPQSLPGGRAVLFRVQPRSLNRIEVLSLETGERKVLIERGTDARYVPTGHLVYAQGETPGTLLAVPFDSERLEVTGAPAPILEGVMQSPVSNLAQFSFSSQGSLVYVPGGVQEQGFTLVWVDRQGAVDPLPAPPRVYLNARLSPDGQRMAVTIAENPSDVWVYDISRDTLTRLTFEGDNRLPVWTPDGERVTFRSDREGPRNIFWKPADGSGAAERLTTSAGEQTPSSWSPDGQLLAFYERYADETGTTSNRDIWVLPLEAERKPQPFLQTPFEETAGMFSPDGRRLAYVSNESGRLEVYVQPYPGPGGKWQISTEGGTEPVWARNGELFYRNGNEMMAAEITTEPTFSAGTPRLLFEGNYQSSGGALAQYNVTSDGQRFLMIQPVEPEQPATQIHVVLNWFEELKQRVPSGQ